MTKEKDSSRIHKVLTIVGTVLCIILIPILIINIVLITKSFTNEEEVPNIGGITPLIVLTDSMVPEIYSGDLIITDVENAKNARVDHYGAGTYVTYIEDTSKQQYNDYLQLVEESGFLKHSDNGEGLDNAVFCSSYTKDDMVLTVSYYAREQKTNISFYQDFPLSDHLICQDSYVNGNKTGAKTKLHMLELRRLGNSFVFQLKNGHFLISDGGMPYDLVYLLDYLESLTPEGEKPVVEAWVISHGHGDHCGALNAFVDIPEHLGRICVEGVYFSEPSQRVTDKCGGSIQIGKMKQVIRLLKTSQGEQTPMYRPQTGQRYYFSDITMDILITQEQVPFEKYKKDLNLIDENNLNTIDKKGDPKGHLFNYTYSTTDEGWSSANSSSAPVLESSPFSPISYTCMHLSFLQATNRNLPHPLIIKLRG